MSNKTHSRMPAAAVLALVVSVVMIAGCSKEGSVRVANATNYNVSVSIMQSPDVIIPPGGEVVQAVPVSKGIFPPSEREIEVSGVGVVANPFSVRLVVGDGDEGQVTVEANAAALVVLNQLECTCRQVFIRGCGVGQWGGNRLANPLRPEAARSFRLEPGCYDARIVSIECPEDPFSREYLGRQLEIGVADTVIFRLTDG